MKTKLLIFGVTGDLSRRKLLPALQAILKTDQFDDLEIIGISRRQITAGDVLDGAVTEKLSSKFSPFTMDVANEDDYRRLKDSLELNGDGQVLAYLSVPPGASSQIIELLGKTGINTPNVKLLLEKPFGMDYTSAVEMNERISQYFDETHVYRIDHYLAKEMAQNIVAFRRSNALFSHVWNNQAIEKIEVVASETLGLEGRNDFYEQTGALRDVLQGHLMQLLSLVLLDLPEDFSWQNVSALRRRALEQLQLATVENACRAQYRGYAEEAGNPGSLTETFASVTLYSDAPQWQNVSFVLATGKALDKKTTEIRIHFRKFHEAQGNVLALRIQPDEAVEMEFFAKKPGYENQLETRKLAFTYDADTTLPDAYEHVIVDAIRSRKSLFPSSEEILASWKVLQPILDAWQMDDTLPAMYEPGSATHSICRA